MEYSNIVGQEEAIQRLQRMVTESRVPHALMFTGREGCGNLPAALAFAAHLFCKTPVNNGPCGKCAACMKIDKLAHPDLHLVYPIALSKNARNSSYFIKEFREAFFENPYMSMNQWFGKISAENKQPIIPVDEANEILRKLSYTSYEGSYKIMVIWQPERMNADSANKLLKILEEPPDQTIFILVANQPEMLLPTIISRVQQIPFYQATEETISGALQAQFGISKDAAMQTAILADGSYGEAIRLLQDNDENVSFLNHFQTFMRTALKFDAAKAVQWVDENATAGRERHKQFLHYGLQVFRDCLMFNYGDRNLVKLSGQEKQFLEKFAPFVHQRNYEKLVEEFNSNYYYIERNANPKILFMDLLLKTNELINLKL